MKLKTILAPALLNCLFLLALAQEATATTYYVATNGTDSAAGTNWVTAKRTIQAGVNAAVAGDTVLVSNGVYATGVTVPHGCVSRTRVAITNNITVQSVNGSTVTSITGAFDGGVYSDRMRPLRLHDRRFPRRLHTDRRCHNG